MVPIEYYILLLTKINIWPRSIWYQGAIRWTSEII